MGALTQRVDANGVDILLDGTSVARYVLHPTMPGDESPRPFLSALRTPSGVRVSDAAPPDHAWHRDLSLALPYVGPANLWGGRTWDATRREYLDLGNNGAMLHESLEPAAGTDGIGVGFTEHLRWVDTRGGELARERRELRFSTQTSGWRVEWSTYVTVSRSLAFGSPATHGREGAGYGGIFLRAAPSFRDGTITTSETSTADDGVLIGTSAEWMSVRAWDASATVALAVPSAAPWFVRTREYPGLGPAPFFHDERVLHAGETLHLHCHVLVADGALTRGTLERDLLRR